VVGRYRGGLKRRTSRQTLTPPRASALTPRAFRPSRRARWLAP
jgi:hypothetical protein